jgi:hypothetical protein
MTLVANLVTRIRAHLAGTADHGTPREDIDLGVDLLLKSGIGANQVDVVFSDQRTIAASGNETLDLAGALANGIGGAAAFAKIKALLIRAAASNINNVVVGAAASNPFLGPLGGTAPTLTLPPSGFVLLAAPVNGWASADGASDSLKISNSGAGTGVTYDIVALGTSA